MPAIRDSSPSWAAGLQSAATSFGTGQRAIMEQQRHQMEMEAAQSALDEHERRLGQERADAQAAQLRLQGLESLTQIERKSEEDWASDARQMYQEMDTPGMLGVGMAAGLAAPKAMERFEERRGRLEALLPRMSPQARELLLQRAEADAQQEVIQERSERVLERWEGAMRQGDLGTGNEQEDAQIQEAGAQVLGALEAGEMGPDEAEMHLKQLRHRAASVRAASQKRQVDVQNFTDYIGDTNDPRLIALQAGVSNGSIDYDDALGRAFSLKEPKAAKALAQKQLSPGELYAQAYQMVSRNNQGLIGEEFEAEVQRVLSQLQPQPEGAPGFPSAAQAGMEAAYSGGGVPGPQFAEAPRMDLGPAIAASQARLRGEARQDRAGVERATQESAERTARLEASVPPDSITVRDEAQKSETRRKIMESGPATAATAGALAALDTPPRKRARNGMRGWRSLSKQQKAELVDTLAQFLQEHRNPDELGIDVETLPQEVREEIRKKAGVRPRAVRMLEATGAAPGLGIADAVKKRL